MFFTPEPGNREIFIPSSPYNTYGGHLYSNEVCYGMKMNALVKKFKEVRAGKKGKGNESRSGTFLDQSP